MIATAETPVAKIKRNGAAKAGAPPTELGVGTGSKYFRKNDSTDYVSLHADLHAAMVPIGQEYPNWRTHRLERTDFTKLAGAARDVLRMLHPIVDGGMGLTPPDACIEGVYNKLISAVALTPFVQEPEKLAGSTGPDELFITMALERLYEGAWETLHQSTLDDWKKQDEEGFRIAAGTGEVKRTSVGDSLEATKPAGAIWLAGFCVRDLC